MTGHDDGLITINLAEADDAERERGGSRWASPTARCSATSATRSRTTTGTAWWRIGGAREFRAAVRRRAADYGEALQQHYAKGRRPTGRTASSPPTRARIRGRTSPRPGRTTSTWSTRWRPRARSACGCGRTRCRARTWRPRSISIRTIADIDRIIDAWLPLTFAVNSINRSMGLPDLYPFVLAPAVIVEARRSSTTAFTRRRAHARERPGPRARAVIAGLKRGAACASQA